MFLKEADMGINDGVDTKIISHLEEQLKFQTEVAAMMILTVVAWAVNAFNLSNGRRNSLTELVSPKRVSSVGVNVILGLYRAMSRHYSNGSRSIHLFVLAIKGNWVCHFN